MVVIFIGSTDLGSSHNSSRILGPIIRWFKPNITPEAMSQVLYGIRKAGHISEYGVLAILILGALTKTTRHPRLFSTALGLCILYAATDEFHQSFVPSRDSAVRDVAYDSAGSLIGLGICRLQASRRRAEKAS